MTASVPAAGAALEMIRSREYDISILEIAVFLRCGSSFNRFVNFGYSSLWIAIFSCQTRDHLQARWAQASQFNKILCEPTKNVSRNHDLVAPARPLVRVTFGNATLIVASTKWASFISAQTRKRGEDGARIGIPIFHAMIVMREWAILKRTLRNVWTEISCHTQRSEWPGLSIEVAKKVPRCARSQNVDAFYQ